MGSTTGGIILQNVSLSEFENMLSYLKVGDYLQASCALHLRFHNTLKYSSSLNTITGVFDCSFQAL